MAANLEFEELRHFGIRSEPSESETLPAQDRFGSSTSVLRECEKMKESVLGVPVGIC